jgi:hypothetical protein
MTQPLTVSLAPNQLSQVINPWSWSMGDFSLFTVNLGQSAAPAVETRVLDEVGSYGRQLGRIGDAFRVIMSRTDLKDLSPADQAAIDALNLQLDHIDVLKRAAGPAATAH